MLSPYGERNSIVILNLELVVVLPVRNFAAVLLAATLVTAASGSDNAGTEEGADSDRPTVVVTTNILGDVVANIVGDEMNVMTILPVGVDPHDFQASAQQVDQIETAGVLIVNGGGFEEGILDVIESAEEGGVPVFEALGSIKGVLELTEHAGEAEEGDHEDEHGGSDPHFFADPARMAQAASGIAVFLADNVHGVDLAALEAQAAEYIAELESLDAEVESALSEIPKVDRVLVTNHEVLAYFADRYDFEVVGTVIPSGTTADSASAGELAALVDVIQREGVGAIFADTSSSADLARTLADEVGEIEVVELFSESLGDEGSDGSTYLDMVRTNAERIRSALVG